MSILIDETWMPELRAVAKDFKEDRLTELGLICHMARLLRDSGALS